MLSLPFNPVKGEFGIVSGTNIVPEINNRKPFQRYLECVIITFFFIPERAKAVSGVFNVLG